MFLKVRHCFEKVEDIAALSNGGVAHGFRQFAVSSSAHRQM